MKGKKTRISIPEDVAAQVLFLTNRTCCVCNTPGKPIQLHHIDEDPSHNSSDNLAVLCLDCHNDTMLKGGFGRKLDASQVKKYKDEWIKRILKRKDDADKIASIHIVTESDIESDLIEYKGNDDLELLTKYLNNILIIHQAQLVIAKTKWNQGTTLSMKQQCYDIIDFYEEVFKELATFYPRDHFGTIPSKYFSELISSRYTWHRLISEPYGRGTGGTIVGILVASSVTYDTRVMVGRAATELIHKFGLSSKVTSEWGKQWFRN